MISKEELALLNEELKEKKSGKTPWETLWKEIAENMDLAYGSWSQNKKGSVAAPPKYTIRDTTARNASEILADGVAGHAFSQQSAWFNYEIKNVKEGADKSVAESLVQKIESVAYKWLNSSNFYQKAHAFIRCGADMSSSCMLMEYDKVENVPIFTVLHLSDVFPITDRHNRIVGLYRRLLLTKSEAESYFGKENVARIFKANEKPNKTERFTFWNLEAPVSMYDFDIKGSGPYFSVYWAENYQEGTIKEERLNNRDFAFWRWSEQIFGGSWGVDGPGMTTLAAAKLLNLLQEDMLTLTELMAKGLWKKTKGLYVNFKAGGVTEVENGQDFARTQATGDLTWIQYWVDRLTQRINSGYRTDVFLILMQNMEKQKTATEVAGLQDEQSSLLASFFFRLGKDFLSPILEWMFLQILLYGDSDMEITEDEIRAIEDLEVEVTYASPLFKSQQRAFELQPSLDFVSDMAQLASLSPSVMDRVDFDQLVELDHKLRKAKEEILIPLEKAEEVRKQRAMAQNELLNRQNQNENLANQLDAYQALSKAPEKGSPIASN